MKFIHTSDLHIGASKFLGDDYLDRQLGAIDTIVAFAQERGIDTIVVAGDIFDVEQPEPKEREALLERLLAYDRMGMRFLCIRGNHDQGSMTGRTAIRYLAHMTDHGVFKHSVFAERTQYVRVGDTVFLLLCHNPRYFQEECAKAIHNFKRSSMHVPHTNFVVIAHEAIKGSVTDTNYRMSGGAEIPLDVGETVPDQPDVTYWAFGDIHVCFPPEIQVMVDYDKCCSIREAVESPAITHVLSYNLEEKRIERKPITCKRESKFRGKYTKITLTDDSTLKSTDDHKYIVVGKGATPAKDIQPGDQLIQYAGSFHRVYACIYCDQTFDSYRAKITHAKTHDDLREFSCDHCGDVFPDRGTKGGHIQVCTPERVSKQNLVKCEICGMMFQERNIGAHMFFHDSQASVLRNDRIRASLLQHYASDAGVANRRNKRDRWMLGEYWKLSQCMPRLGIQSRGERFVASLNVSNLVFTGHGDFWIALPNGDGSYRNKNPDFVFGDPKDRNSVTKVVEVFGGMGYFHTEEEMVTLKAAYAAAGITALIIDDRRLTTKQGRDAVRAELEAFGNNHYVTVKKVHNYVRKAKTDNLVYSLEVADNFNFFAVSGDYTMDGRVHTLTTPVLVNNCQRLGPQAFYCGSPIQTKFGDSWPKGVLVVDTTNAGNPEFVAIPSRPLVKVVVNPGETPEFPENAHIKLVAPPTVYADMRDQGVLPDNIARIEAVKDTVALDYAKALDLPSKVFAGLEQMLPDTTELDMAKREASALFSAAGVA